MSLPYYTNSKYGYVGPLKNPRDPVGPYKYACAGAEQGNVAVCQPGGTPNVGPPVPLDQLTSNAVNNIGGEWYQYNVVQWQPESGTGSQMECVNKAFGETNTKNLIRVRYYEVEGAAYPGSVAGLCKAEYSPVFPSEFNEPGGICDSSSGSAADPTCISTLQNTAKVGAGDVTSGLICPAQDITPSGPSPSPSMIGLIASNGSGGPVPVGSDAQAIFTCGGNVPRITPRSGMHRR